MVVVNVEPWWGDILVTKDPVTMELWAVIGKEFYNIFGHRQGYYNNPWSYIGNVAVGKGRC